MAVLMPTTSPAMLNSGPPELPRLIAASVWMKSSYRPWRMSRPRAETMPAVTEPPRPKGLPIASTQSPTCAVSELPNCTAVSGLSVRMRSTAISVRGSVPSSSARIVVLSDRITLISSAPSITWLLVTTMPSRASMMKPEPSDCPRRCGRCGVCGAPSCPGGRLRLKKSRKNSSNGLPGGACGISGASGRPGRAWTAWVVEMLTTAGRSCRAKGAKVSGARCAKASGAKDATAMAAARARAAKRTVGHLMGGVGDKSAECHVAPPGREGRRHHASKCGAARRACVARRGSTSPAAEQPGDAHAQRGRHQPADPQVRIGTCDQNDKRPPHGGGREGIGDPLQGEDNGHALEKVPYGHCNVAGPAGAAGVAGASGAARGAGTTGATGATSAGAEAGAAPGKGGSGRPPLSRK